MVQSVTRILKNQLVLLYNIQAVAIWCLQLNVQMLIYLAV